MDEEFVTALKLKPGKRKLLLTELSRLKVAQWTLYSCILYKNVWNESILNFKNKNKFDLVFTSGVLIHINPEYIDKAYKALYDNSKKYILIIEYYNPSPVQIDYRGHKDKLFKRDFAGEIMKKFKNLKLIDYGFKYKLDNNFPLDDVTWFLLEKK